LEAFTGIAQALADAPGYRIVLQVDLVEPVVGEPGTERIVGYHEVASAEPTSFSETL